MNQNRPKSRTGFRLIGVILLAVCVLPIYTASAQESGGFTSMDLGDNVRVDLAYKKVTIIDFNKPTETHWITGDPVDVKAYYEKSTWFLKAPCLEYKSQDGIFSATSGVSITDGTMTITAKRGRFDVVKRVARFEGDVHWKHLTAGQGDNDILIVTFGKDGIDRIEAQGTGKVGRMSLYREAAELSGAKQSGKVSKEEEAAAVPPVKRAVSPLQQ